MRAATGPKTVIQSSKNGNFVLISVIWGRKLAGVSAIGTVLSSSSYAIGKRFVVIVAMEFNINCLEILIKLGELKRSRLLFQNNRCVMGL